MPHIPERMCIGCRGMFAKQELIRLAESDGEIITDEKQKLQTRGVYICRSEKCIMAARKKKALSRQFHKNISDEVYNRLLEECRSK